MMDGWVRAKRVVQQVEGRWDGVGGGGEVEERGAVGGGRCAADTDADGALHFGAGLRGTRGVQRVIYGVRNMPYATYVAPTLADGGLRGKREWRSQ